MDNNLEISDLTFIGSGISTSFSILNFLNLVENDSNKNNIISIDIIEKFPEFNLGLPYGVRSGFSTHLITSLKNFLAEPELSLFTIWLSKNKSWLLKEYKNEGGILSAEWLNTNRNDIEHDKWEELFIPRRFFGCYIDQLVESKITKLSKANKIFCPSCWSKLY